MGAGTWVLRALLLALLAGCVVAATMLLPHDRIYAEAAQVADLATYPALLSAAALLYLYYRLTPRDTGWLAAAAVFGTSQGIGYAAIRVAMADDVRARSAWMLLSQVVVALILCLMLAASGRVRVPMDPLVLGLSLALATTGSRLMLVHGVQPSPVLRDLEPALTAAVLLLYAAMAALLVLRVPLPAWAGWRLAAVVALLGLAQVLVFPVPVEGWRSLLVVALDVAGATLLAVTCLELVWTVLSRADRAEQQLRDLEAQVRNDRTLLHEVTGTVAGISAASQLLSLPVGLDPQERRRLAELLVAETARVNKLLTAAEDDLADVDLDTLIDSVLFAHGIRGRLVAWHPTGHHVLARHDHLREVLDVLLDNAARHAQSPVLALTVDRRGDHVEVAVIDQGPGIPPEIAESVLEWGTHGTASNGQGIGLSVAHHLVTGMGGRLRIESDGDVGTRVAVVLPVVEVARADGTA